MNHTSSVLTKSNSLLAGVIMSIVEAFNRMLLFLIVLIISPLSLFSISDALKIKISNVSYSDETVVRFLGSATTGFDSSYDAWKLFSSNANVPAIYTKIDSASELSINALPLLEEETTVALFLRLNVPGNYTFQSIELGAFPLKANIALEDTYTGMVYNFRGGSSFSINLGIISSSSNSRFFLRFSPVPDIHIENVSCNGLENGRIDINKPGTQSFDAFLKNTNGDTLQQALFVVQYAEFNGLPAGNYILELYSEYSTPDTNLLTITQPTAVVSDFSYSSLTSNTFGFTNNSSNASSFLWNFGDGIVDSLTLSPIHQDINDGLYNVVLTAFQGECSVSYSQPLTVSQLTTNLNDIGSINTFIVHQKDELFLLMYTTKAPEQIVKFEVYDMNGRLVYEDALLSNSQQQFIIRVSTGTYIFQLTSAMARIAQKVSIIK